MKSLSLLLFIAQSIFYANSAMAACNNGDDYAALRALYLNTDGDNWLDNTGWPNATTFMANPIPPEGTDIDMWFGITCNGMRITQIDLRDNRLSGTLPSEIGQLQFLEFLDLGTYFPYDAHDNQLIGNIPIQIGNLTNLQTLRLVSNQLTGNIPAQIGNLANLSSLNLFKNQLTGNIPTQIGNLTNLRYLILYDNQLTGNIPIQIENLSILQSLQLGANQLTGNIPIQFGNLANLEILFLDNNQLTGNIPWQLVNCSSLISIRLENNDLSGCYDTRLQHLDTQLGSNGHHNFISAGNSLSNWDEFISSGTGVCCFNQISEVCSSNPCEFLGGRYQAAQTISYSGPYDVIPGSDRSVTLNGGQGVMLLNGFEVKAGAEFEVKTEGCVIN